MSATDSLVEAKAEEPTRAYKLIGNLSFLDTILDSERISWLKQPRRAERLLSHILRGKQIDADVERHDKYIRHCELESESARVPHVASHRIASQHALESFHTTEQLDEFDERQGRFEARRSMRKGQIAEARQCILALQSNGIGGTKAPLHTACSCAFATVR